MVMSGKIRKQPTIFHHTLRKQLSSTNLTNGQDTYLRSSDFTHVFQKLNIWFSVVCLFSFTCLLFVIVFGNNIQCFLH